MTIPGVDAGDFDGDGDDDLFLAHLMEESNTLYVNEGKGFFTDGTIQAGLHLPSLSYTAFGTSWLDYNNDGWLDLVTANGAVRVLRELARRGDPYPLGQPNQLFENGGRGTFLDVTYRAGPAFHKTEVSRGVVSGDLDNDGDSDLLLTNNNGPARVLLNQTGQEKHWLGLRLIGSGNARDMLGARVAVVTPPGEQIWRRVGTDGSYCSSSDPRVLVGLAGRDAVTAVRVYWPDGNAETWKNLPVDSYVTLEKGTSGDAEK